MSEIENIENKNILMPGVSLKPYRQNNYPLWGLLILCGILAAPLANKGVDYVTGNGKVVIIKGDDTPIPAPATLVAVKAAFAKIESKDDQLVIYKLFAGAGDYLSIAEFSGNTAQFDSLLGKVQTSYNWKRDKYPEFTDAVSAYLVEVGYDEPKVISTESERASFAKIFKDLAESLK